MAGGELHYFGADVVADHVGKRAAVQLAGFMPPGLSVPQPAGRRQRPPRRFRALQKAPSVRAVLMTLSVAAVAMWLVGLIAV